MSAQPKTPTTAKAEEVKPLGNLKPTPQIEPTEEEKRKTVELQMQLMIDDNLEEIQHLTRLYKSYNTLDFTLRNLKEFVYKDGEEDSYGASITITDSNRKKFETQNPRLVQALVNALSEILTKKKAELGESIAKITIQK